MASFADLERKIEQLSDAAFRVFHSKRPPTEAQVAAIEARVGRPFPPELRQLIVTWGALVVEVKEEVWPRPKEFDVLPSWRFWFGFRVFGVGDALPEPLRVEASLSDDVRGKRGLPVLARTGARFLAMITDEGLGWWTQSDDSFELAGGNTIDLILEEIQQLEQGVAQLSLRSATVPALLDQARAVGWDSPAADPVLDALKTKSSEELAPHAAAIADAWLGLPTHSMGCLDLVGKSGAAGFATVADRIYAHMGEGDDEWVIDLLGTVRDHSPSAIAIYRAALEGDDESVLSQALSALRQVASEPAARALVPQVQKRFREPFDDHEVRWSVLGLLGCLGAPDFEAEALSALADVDDDDLEDFAYALSGQTLGGGALAQALLERYRAAEPSGVSTINLISSLLDIGVQDTPHMAEVLQTHVVPGGRWTARAEEELARLSS